MCGRFSLVAEVEELAEAFSVSEQLDEPEARFNIAPSQALLAVVAGPERRFVRLRWGLIPSWAKDPSMGTRLINARAETVAEKPSFRSAFKARRCLIPATGFYEWQRREASKKQPYYLRLQDMRPFAFAGLWERWTGPEGEVIDSCTILTTSANTLMKPIHDRMPVILEPRDYELWLDPDTRSPDRLIPLLKPYPPDQMSAHQVSPLVNSPANDSPECINSL
ncbi:MAG: SOS response-associated peptidase [Gemmatimonadaceae bacterium]|nr:SOS response-associated peptidase [Gloeobacterales cyanobacterium ES-bin-141]